MESLNTKRVAIWMGDYPVVDITKIGGIVIDLGKGVHVTIHIGSMPHNTAIGQTLPLFTEIETCQP
jgi:hypothetical protein